MGMVGARELLPGEAPALHAAVERLAARAGVVRPRLYLLADGYPRALSAGRGAGGGAGARGLDRAPGRGDAGGARGDRRARARALRRRDVLVQTIGGHDRGRRSSRRRALGGSVQRALLFVLGAAGRRDRAPAALAEARVRGRPLRGRAVRLAARARGRAAPARAGDGARRVRGEPGDRAALHDESVRRGGPRRALRHASRRSASACAGCARSTPTGARSSARPDA